MLIEAMLAAQLCVEVPDTLAAKRTEICAAVEAGVPNDGLLTAQECGAIIFRRGLREIAAEVKVNEGRDNAFTERRFVNTNWPDDTIYDPIRCGDAELDTGESCDAGGDSLTCDADCTAAECGDGYLNTAAGEACDDNNVLPGDGCDASCQVE